MTFQSNALEASTYAQAVKDANPGVPSFNLGAIPEEHYEMFTREALIRQIATNLLILDELESIVQDASEASPPLPEDELVVATLDEIVAFSEPTA